VAYYQHDLFTDPKDVKLWRYMDFTKLVSLLQKKALFFPSAKILQKIDPWEGKYPKNELKEILRKEIQEFNKKKISYKAIQNHIDDLLRDYNIKFETSYISCWHFNTSESSAMWGLYVKGNEGISIQTDIISFKSSFNNLKKNIYIGQVRYKDYEIEEFYNNDIQYVNLDIRRNLFPPFIHKRKNYEYEKEYRAIISDLIEKNKDNFGIEKQQNGIFVSADLKLLIKKIILAPGSPEWFKELIEETLKTYKLDVKVVRSVVDDEPYKFDLEPYKDLK
jgi:hypothetical protein